MKLYTRTGDQGITGLLTGQRVAKDSIRVEAYGTVDEVNSALGLARAFCTQPDVRDAVYSLQKLLVLFMADMASINAKQLYITPEHITTMEAMIDSFDDKLPPLNRFIIPGDNPGAAALDMARTIARRAERQVLKLSRMEQVNNNLLAVLNRLSDLCFILSRAESTRMTQECSSQHIL